MERLRPPPGERPRLAARLLPVKGPPLLPVAGVALVVVARPARVELALPVPPHLVR